MNRQAKPIIFFFCILKLALHLIADSHSGFQGDELLHIESGKHLATGYMEFPPLIAFLAFIQNLTGSTSVYVHHFFAHLASIVIMLYVGKTTIKLGGGNIAVFLALLCVLVGPGFERSQQLFQPVVFGQLFWTLSFYQLVCYVKDLDKKNLAYLSTLVTIGFLFKYDLSFFIAGLSCLFIFKRIREMIIRQQVFIYIIIGLLIVSPNIYWQTRHNFPVLQMFGRLYETQLNKLTRLDNIKNLFLAINPLTAILVIPAFVYMFNNNRKVIFRPLAISISISFALLLIFNGKSYYFFPLILTLLPFGGIFWEQLVIAKRKWVIYPVTLILLVGALLIPFGMPVYTFERYLDRIHKYESKKVEGGTFAVGFDEYYTKEKWKTTLTDLKQVYDSLPAIEKRDCRIWGKHYAQAGAISLFKNKYNLPGAFSYHGSFYTWAPTGEMPNTVIALSYRIGNYFDPYFEDVQQVRTIYNPYADTEEELFQYIYVCKKPKQSFDKMKTLFERRIFE